MEFDWSAFTTLREVRMPEQQTNYRQILIDGLLQSLVIETASFIMGINVVARQISNAKESAETSEEILEELGEQLAGLFEKRRETNAGILISELPDPETIGFFKSKYKVEPDIIDAVRHVNISVRALNQLPWYSHEELCIGVRQINSFLKGLRGGEDINYFGQFPVAS